MAGRRIVPPLLFALLSGVVLSGPATGAATAAVTVVDPAGDVTAPIVNGDLPPTDPRVDLLSYTITYGEFVTLLVRTALPDASVLASVEVGLNDDAGLDHSDFRVSRDGLTQFVEGTGEVRRCDVSSGMVGSAYVLQFKATCIGAPPAVWAPFGMRLDLRVGDPAGREPYTWRCVVARCAPFAIYQDAIAGSGPVARRLGTDPFVVASPTVTVAIVGTPSGKGHWIARSDGRVMAHGDAPDLGGAGTELNWPIVGAVGTPTGGGLWLTARDGGVFTSGDAQFFGSLDSAAHGFDARGVGLATTPTGGGYWLTTSFGRVLPFGDAPDLGSRSRALNERILGIRATPTGLGYWLVASDGGIFTFGDAAFHGSTGNLRLNQPVVGMAPTPTGQGYWLVASDGGIFSFGDAAFHGSTGNLRLNQPVVGMAPTPTGQGYWLVAADGGVFTFGDAAFHGAALIG